MAVQIVSALLTMRRYPVLLSFPPSALRPPPQVSSFIPQPLTIPQPLLLRLDLYREIPNNG